MNQYHQYIVLPNKCIIYYFKKLHLLLKYQKLKNEGETEVIDYHLTKCGNNWLIAFISGYILQNYAIKSNGIDKSLLSYCCRIVSDNYNYNEKG